MAIVTLFISVALAFIWLVETKAGAYLSPLISTVVEAVGITALYFLFAAATRYRSGAKADSDDGKSAAEGCDILIAYASQTGFAEELALRTRQALAQAGWTVRLVAFSQLDKSVLKETETALFIASTTGEGDAPDAAIAFAGKEMAGNIDLSHLHYAVLALGDTHYRDFCAFGRHLDAWLQDNGARALFDRIDVDQGDEEAVARWFTQLQRFGAEENDRSPDFQQWRLTERRLLNPGSDNPPVYHVCLSPEASLPSWRAGDIAIVAPRNSVNAVDLFLQDLSLAGSEIVTLRDGRMTLHEALMKLQLPQDVEEVLKMNPQALVDSLRRLPVREYSLASLPSDEQVELVVRQMRRADGSLGIGSGWLTEHAKEGERIEIRLRANGSFHGPDPGAPMIMIGAGSGIAGLRAHMKERIAAGSGHNWLIFGERSRDTDYLFQQEIEYWQASRALARLDLCFMENGAQRMVQDVLNEQETELREWLKAGASIFLSGSRARLGVGVETALTAIIGETGVRRLKETGRYKADVY